MKILVVVDMQNDFVTGALKNEQARMIVPNVVEKLKRTAQDAACRIIFTADTHTDGYLKTEEGIHLPVEHCIDGTWGHEIIEELKDCAADSEVCRKETFGGVLLGEKLRGMEENGEHISSVELIGLCTDICVISNALLVKAFLPDTHITVDAACCAGVTPASHETALDAMQGCQIEVINRGSEPWKRLDK